MMTDFHPTIRETVPGINEGMALAIHNSLWNAEYALGAIVAEATEALNAIRESHNSDKTPEERQAALGLALRLGEFAGYSGTIGANYDKALVSLAVAKSDLNTAAAVARMLAKAGE